MKLLYYYWTEITATDCIEALNRLQYDIVKCEIPLKNYVNDSEFVRKIEDVIASNNFDAIFTFNFLPIISKIALRNKIPYISWIYDCPCMTLYSEMVFNPYNYIFHFDSLEVERMRSLGVSNIWHMPLGVNVSRIDSLLENYKDASDSKLYGDVTFMGNLYTDDYDYIANMNTLPEYHKGFLQAIIESTKKLSGGDLVDELITDKYINEIARYVSFTKEEEFFITDRDMISDIVKKKVSVMDRLELVQRLSEKSNDFNFVLHTNSDCSKLKDVINNGIVDYYKDMSVMFNRSKININMSLRNIRAGVSLRAMDICGAGGFLLTNYANDLYYIFDDSEIAVFSDVNDCIDKINYYLYHEDERINMAQAARKKIADNFTYDIQLRKMFDIVGV